MTLKPTHRRAGATPVATGSPAHPNRAARVRRDQGRSYRYPARASMAVTAFPLRHDDPQVNTSPCRSDPRSRPNPRAHPNLAARVRRDQGRSYRYPARASMAVTAFPLRHDDPQANTSPCRSDPGRDRIRPHIRTVPQEFVTRVAPAEICSRLRTSSRRSPQVVRGAGTNRLAEGRATARMAVRVGFRQCEALH